MPVFENVADFLTTQLREKEQQLTAEEFEKTINIVRNAISCMMDQLYAYRKMPETTEEQALGYSKCEAWLSSVMSDVEKCWSPQCSQQCKLPDAYLDFIRPQLRKQLDTLKKQLYASDVNQQLVMLLLEPLAAIIAARNVQQVTGSLLQYMETLFTEISTLAEAAQLHTEKLIQLLLRLNFNSKDFIDYYCNTVDTKLEQEPIVTEKLHQLKLLVNAVSFYIMGEKDALISDSSSVANGVLHWAAHQWVHWFTIWEKEMAQGGEQHELEKYIKADSIAYTENGAVISVLYDMLVTSGFIKGSRASVLRNVAQNGELPNTKTPSARYLEKEGKKNNKTAKDRILLHYMPFWSEFLSGKMPGKRS